MKKLGSQRHFTGKNPISGSVDHREASMSGTHTTGDVCISLCVCHKEPERTLRVESSYGRRVPGFGVCLTRALWLYTETNRISQV